MTSQHDGQSNGGASARLAIRDALSGRVHPIRDGFAVGRAFGDLVLEDQPGISRKHGEFRVADSIVVFSQNEVRNPVKLNGAPIASGCAATVRAGDRLEFGARSFEVIAMAEAPELLPAADAAAPFEEPAPYLYPPQPASASASASAFVPPSPNPGPAAVRLDKTWGGDGRDPRAGALVTLSAAILGVVGLWQTMRIFEGAAPDDEWRVWIAAAICAAGPLGVARLLWSSTRARAGAHPAWAALSLLVFIFGLEGALPNWLDAVTGVFSQAQANGLVRTCGGESFKSGPCAAIYDACGPRCRRYALPQLVDAMSGENGALAPKTPPSSMLDRQLEKPAAEKPALDAFSPGVALARPPRPLSTAPPAVAPPAPREPASLPGKLAPPSPKRSAASKKIPTKLPAKASASRGFPEPPRMDKASRAPAQRTAN